MKHLSHFSRLARLCLCLIPASVWGQELPEPSHIQWGLIGGFNQYQEKGIMQLQGPEFGIHAKFPRISILPLVQWEVDVLLGRQKYTSSDSGSKTGVTNLEERWRALTPILIDASPFPHEVSAGLALHTLWNDLRGTTTFNEKTYAGYERFAAQLWIPMRWSNANTWSLETGLLLYGQHTSKLSQANANYSDIVNTQRKGQYAQFTMHLRLDNGNTVKPFVRYTHLGDSNIVVMNGERWLEPASHRWQIGCIWE